MNWYATIKRYYDAGIYNNDPASPMYVGNFVEYGKITAAEYYLITGVEYAA